MSGEADERAGSVMKKSVSQASSTDKVWPPEFLSEINRLIRALSKIEFISEDDFKDALIIYHSFVGILAMVDLQDLAKKARELEEAVTNKSDELRSKQVQFILSLGKLFGENAFSQRDRSLKDILRPIDLYLKEMALQQKKKINDLLISNGDIFLPPKFQGELLAIFSHLSRNAIDHGIETPAERLHLGKSEAGNIRIEAHAKNKDQIEIHFQDDGSGIAPELLERIFDFGFSTCEKRSEISGQGVGLHSVKKTTEDLGGSIEVKSTFGKGATFIIRLPSQD